MPYGLPGGRDKDTKLEKWMERCVERVMNQGKDKTTSIMICKAILKKNKYKIGKASLETSLLLTALKDD